MGHRDEGRKNASCWRMCHDSFVSVKIILLKLCLAQILEYSRLSINFELSI